MNRRLLIVSAAVSLTGCTTTYHEPTLPAGHPANAAADTAPPLERTRTLALETDDGPPESAKPTIPHAGQRDTEHGSHVGGAHDAGAAPNAESAAAALYVCPMHSEVMSDKPDQRCPKCGMKLVKKEGAKQP